MSLQRIRQKVCCLGFESLGGCAGAWRFLLAQFFLGLLSASAFAAHPLITDDTGTQGGGKFQVELNTEFSHDHEGEATEDSFEFATIITYGVLETVDLVLGVPYQHSRREERGFKSTQAGISDLSLELKWRFWESSGWSAALKPGVRIPTGDKEEGPGSGRVSPALFFISTKEIEPWAFHLNLGYIRNENSIGERTDLWHASIAFEWEFVKDLKAVANVGAERNPEQGSAPPPVFILGGLIYSLGENLDLDLGVKGGLTRSEPDCSILTGLAWRF